MKFIFFKQLIREVDNLLTGQKFKDNKKYQLMSAGDVSRRWPSPRSSVGSVEDLRTGVGLFEPPARPIFFPRTDDLVMASEFIFSFITKFKIISQGQRSVFRVILTRNAKLFTLDITFELYDIRPSYLTYEFIVKRTFCSLQVQGHKSRSRSVSQGHLCLKKSIYKNPYNWPYLLIG